MCAMTYPTWIEFMGGWDEFTEGSLGAKETFPMIAAEMPTFMGSPQDEHDGRIMSHATVGRRAT